MADPVRASEHEVKRISAISRQEWSARCDAANAELGLSLDCIQPRNLLGKVPAYLAFGIHKDKKDLPFKIHRNQLQNQQAELSVTGGSTWRTSEGDCDLGPKYLPHHVLLGVQRSTACVFAERMDFNSWPGIQMTEDGPEEGNHLAILAFAWAYIFSARWIEMQRSYDFSPHIQYMDDAQAHWSTDSYVWRSDDLEVNLGYVSDEAARWWAALLATGEGWRATIRRNGQVYRSPWSVCITAAQRFVLRSADGCSSYKGVAPSSADALMFLSDFCETHNLRGQASAAMCAAFYFPLLNGSTAALPFPRTYPSFRTPAPVTAESLVMASPRDIVHAESQLLPYYMTLSCHRRGIRSLLSSTFFDPDIYCNLVGPWLEPMFKLVDAVIKREEDRKLALIMARKAPKLGALWLGAILTGTALTILRDIHNGLSAPDLHAAEWTGTLQSFIVVRPSPCTDGNEISRADECRLLFLSGCENRSTVPTCPWQPFGKTSLVDTEIDVRKHAQCKNHYLRYNSWSWDMDDGTVVEDRGFNRDAKRADKSEDEVDTIPPSNHELPPELLSELATRSIFSWLRPTGFSANEAPIRDHSWLDLEYSDELDGDASSDNSRNGTAPDIMNEWLDSVEETDPTQAVEPLAYSVKSLYFPNPSGP
ncbi:MAG: hypothetical protein M4579_006586 [Chaenotheca gracillima]|nr:MAG: hypothetical protein M4579_006586 [Chaenotheca gracillima]